MSLNPLLLHIETKARFTLLLGAGASITSGGYLADDIAFGILKRLYGSLDRDELISSFRKEFKREVTFDTVLESVGRSNQQRRRVLDEYFSNMEPSPGYRYLAMLVKEGVFHNIILTTNHDPLLERTLRETPTASGKGKVTVLCQEEIAGIVNWDSDTIYIVQLHGGFDDAASLKVARSDTLLLNADSERLVMDSVEQQGLVVLGFSGRDRDIMTALARADKSDNGIYWISYNTGGNYDHITDILAKHDSVGNIIEGVDFDEFFKTVGLGLSSVLSRRTQSKVLDDQWALIERARSFGKGRIKTLHGMVNTISDLEHCCDLDEVRALREFVSYELDRTGETYRLYQGVELLDAALDVYRKHMRFEEISQLELARLTELLNLFLTGEQIPGGRRVHLEKLIVEGDEVARKVDRSDKLLRARFIVLLCEAMKEKAMIVDNPDDYRKAIEKAVAYSEAAVELLRDVKDQCRNYLIGSVYRHRAVLHELKGDIAFNETERINEYREWRKCSAQAVELLKKINEDAVHGYALINHASSGNRLLDFESSESRRKQMLQESLKEIDSAITMFRRIGDARGEGWALIHKCESLEKLSNLCVDELDLHHLLQKLESTASHAVSALRISGDHLALGLSYMRLGVALYRVNEVSKDKLRVKHNRAMIALQEGFKLLEATSYYRGAGEAMGWLAKVQYAEWERAHVSGGAIEFLAEAVQSLTKGAILTAVCLSDEDALDCLYKSLERELNKML